MECSSLRGLADIQRLIDEVKRFLSATLGVANAHTVEFYTHDVWSQFMSVRPEEVLSAIHQGAPRHNANEVSNTTYGFCDATKRLVDVQELLKAAKSLSLPGLGVCMSRDELLQTLRATNTVSQAIDEGAVLEPDEFMNSKKSHEVQSMSEVVACLARRCGVNQVIDVGSGKGYLCSFLSLQYGLHVYGIDSSSTNTHGAQERNRKLKRFSRAYQKHSKAAVNRSKPTTDSGQEDASTGARTASNETDAVLDVLEHRFNLEPNAAEEEITSQGPTQGDGKHTMASSAPTASSEVQPAADGNADHSGPCTETEDPFLGSLSEDAVEVASPRMHPGELSAEERERRKRENLERKARNRPDRDGMHFSPLTSYVTPQTELRELISELEDAVMVGLHTCGDLAPSTLRMFVAKPELASVCSVGCCYHLLTEQYDPSVIQDCVSSVYGFPMSQYLRDQSWFCGRNARMSACLALERVSVGQGIQMESLFYRAVLHVILRDHYGGHKSEKRVGNVYSKATSFVDYVQRALRRLELDGSKLCDSDIQDYYDRFTPRMAEMHAFNMLKVRLAPCIEGLILLDRLCYLKEQEDIGFSAVVQLFDPVLSPRCFAVVGVKSPVPTVEQPHSNEPL